MCPISCMKSNIAYLPGSEIAVDFILIETLRFWDVNQYFVKLNSFSFFFSNSKPIAASLSGKGCFTFQSTTNKSNCQHFVKQSHHTCWRNLTIILQFIWVNSTDQDEHVSTDSFGATVILQQFICLHIWPLTCYAGCSGHDLFTWNQPSMQLRKTKTIININNFWFEQRVVKVFVP